MNIELKKEKIYSPSRICTMSCNENIDLEINLPDYCSDIKRILRCFVIPGINSVQLTGDRASAKGEITIRLVYVGEGDKIDCYEQITDLSDYVDVKNLPENPVVTVKAKTQFVNCRAASQRRFVVGASVSVDFSVYGSVENNICSFAPDDLLQTKKSSFKAINKSVVSQKMFDISETVALKDDNKSIGKIISCEPVPIIESVKTVNGKMLVKGDLVCTIVYCTDSKDRSIEKINHTMPISQVIEVPGIDESFLNDISVSVSSVAANAKTDSSGNNMLVELAAKLSLFVVGTREDDISFISDCYSTGYESKAEYKNFELKKVVHSLDMTKKITADFDCGEQAPNNIIDIKTLSVSDTYSLKDNAFKGKGSILFGIIFEDKNNELQYIERNADFDFDCELDSEYNKISCDPDILIKNVKGSPNSAKISLSFEAEISGNIYCEQSIKILEGVTVDEQKPKSESDAAITVYFCSKGESVWDIAKKYNTSVNLICEENSIESDKITNDAMLIVPCL